MTAREKFDQLTAEYDAAYAEYKTAEEELFRYVDDLEGRPAREEAVRVAVAKVNEVHTRWNEAKKEISANHPVAKFVSLLKK